MCIGETTPSEALYPLLEEDVVMKGFRTLMRALGSGRHSIHQRGELKASLDTILASLF